MSTSQSMTSEEVEAVEADRLGNAPFTVLVPVLMSFFVMGFVDLVGTASNYVQSDFGLSDSVSNIFTTMTFFWFLVLSVPAGMLMNRIGRRHTVLVSIAITALGCLLPIIGYLIPAKPAQLAFIIVSFCLLGVGNTFMQVSLNPLVGNLAHDEKLAGMLTFGQFVKAIASFIAPLIAGWAAMMFGRWWLLYPIYLVVAILSFVMLKFDEINENAPDSGHTSVADCFALLRNPVILLCFLGIVCHVGVDVGINATAPKILMEHSSIGLEVAGGATSVYFAFRTLGCLSGSVLLQRFSRKAMLRVCGGLMAASSVCFLLFSGLDGMPVWLAYAGLACVGLGNANVFSIMLTTGLLHLPQRQNEVSGLMMIGLIGGAIFPPLMGLASDMMGMQLGAILVMTVGVIYVTLMGVFFRSYGNTR
ncbi:sugar transport protein [Bifidobacterium margollesii]|uniref:Sugar transport protein n=1 Tax=Bifidobacterium margollesii TaxID=2020964 RepID=A0A2N5J8W7_9BIFI|nr:MFS transporter [Bifidobacterium margollesii]PLS30653.1 sugar transport protein [Bifidobacterium margollesii]